jgi:hypothetical protein
MDPEQVYCIEIEMYPTSNLFSAGHHLAVYVTSSSYPMFDINPNTGSPAGFLLFRVFVLLFFITLYISWRRIKVDARRREYGVAHARAAIAHRIACRH